MSRRRSLRVVFDSISPAAIAFPAVMPTLHSRSGRKAIGSRLPNRFDGSLVTRNDGYPQLPLQRLDSLDRAPVCAGQEHAVWSTSFNLRLDKTENLCRRDPAD